MSTRTHETPTTEFGRVGNRDARECPESGRYPSFKTLPNRLKLSPPLLVVTYQSKEE